MPTYLTLKKLFVEAVNINGVFTSYLVSMRRNEIEFYDSLLASMSPSISDSFYSISNIERETYPSGPFPRNIMMF